MKLYFLSSCLLFANFAYAQLPQQPNPIAELDQDQNPSFRFDTFAGRSYFFQSSETLEEASWTYFPELIDGDDTEKTMTMQSDANKLFFRLKTIDLPTPDKFSTDHDNDGVPSFAELTISNTDPLKFSTADNGISDKALFPSPASGVVIDESNGVQYVTNPQGESGGSEVNDILATPYFSAPDYKIEYKALELNTEKKGYSTFEPTTPAKLYRYTGRGLALYSYTTNQYIQGEWRTMFLLSNPIRITATNTERQYFEINPITGVEQQFLGVDQIILSRGHRFARVHNEHPLDSPFWDFRSPTRLYETVVSSGFTGGNYLSVPYDLPPFDFFTNGQGVVDYERFIYGEVNIEEMSLAFSQHLTSYPSSWTEGSPWGVVDEWADQNGAYYRKFKFRIINKGDFSAETPAIATVFFRPESGGPAEEVQTVTWDGSGLSSPEYEVDPFTLRPGEEGEFFVGVVSSVFEIVDDQKQGRVSGGAVLIPLISNSSASLEVSEASQAIPKDSNQLPRAVAGNVQTANSTESFAALSTIAEFPGMRDIDFEDAEILLEALTVNPETNEANTGAVQFKAVGRFTGNEVSIPYGQNLAADFFHSEGDFSSFDWKVEGLTAGTVSIRLSYNKGSKSIILVRNAFVLPPVEILSPQIVEQSNGSLLKTANYVSRNVGLINYEDSFVGDTGGPPTLSNIFPFDEHNHFILRLPYTDSVNPRVKIGTRNTEGDTIDDLTEVVFYRDQNFYTSHPMALVINDIDDDFVVEGHQDDQDADRTGDPELATIDRTHKINSLDDELVVAISLDDGANWSEIKRPVYIDKTAIMKVPVTAINVRKVIGGELSSNNADIRRWFEEANKRFAQANVQLDLVPILERDPPTGIDLSDGLFNKGIIQANGKFDEETEHYQLTSSIINSVAGAGIRVLYVPYIKDQRNGDTRIGGFTQIPRRVEIFSAFEAEFIKWSGLVVMADYPIYESINEHVNPNATPKNDVLWLAHEIGHVLTNQGHIDDTSMTFDDKVPPYYVDQNIMRDAAGVTPGGIRYPNSFFRNWRFWRNQIELIHKNGLEMGGLYRTND